MATSAWKGSVGALAGAEASATARGELGPVQGKATGGIIAGVGGALGEKVALEDGKLTIGVKDVGNSVKDAFKSIF